jgi:hypothetical protein
MGGLKMGYYSEFEVIPYHKNTKKPDEAFDIDGVLFEYSRYPNFSDGVCHDIKWYDFSDNLCELSKRYPLHYFYVRRLGENKEDIEAGIAMNGKYYKKKLAIIWPAFEEIVNDSAEISSG